MAMWRGLAAIAVSFLLASCVEATLNEQADILNSLTPEHFRDTALVVDDNLTIVATISMENGFQERSALGIPVSHGSFLRAFVNKQTGTVSYQVYTYLTYVAPEWRFYDTVNFRADGSVQSMPVKIIDREVLGCGYVNGCEYEEHLGFAMEADLLRQLAADYRPDGHNPWLFKVTCRIQGDDWTDGIMPSEASGMLMAVSDYKTAHHLR
jgi:hypothetical protein